MSTVPPVLVLGLGNAICGDDGVGVEAIWRLRGSYELPEEVELVDGGTLGLALLPLLESHERVVLVDAVAADAPVGSIVRVKGDDVATAVAHRLSPHQVGVSDLLEVARLRGTLPEHLVLVGIVPGSIALSTERTPVVEGRIDELVTAVLGELAALGFHPRRRGATERAEQALTWDSAHAAARAR